MADTAAVLALVQSQFAVNKPSFFGYQNTVQSLANTAWTPLSIDASVDDNYAGHSNSTNNSRYTAQVAATYRVSGCYAPAANATGFRAVRLIKNGSTILLGSGLYSPPISGAEIGVPTPSALVALAVGDYVEVQGWQSSGGNLNTILDVDLRCSFTVTFEHF
jgi:hypothetical protein